MMCIQVSNHVMCIPVTNLMFSNPVTNLMMCIPVNNLLMYIVMKHYLHTGDRSPCSSVGQALDYLSTSHGLEPCLTNLIIYLYIQMTKLLTDLKIDILVLNHMMYKPGYA